MKIARTDSFRKDFKELPVHVRQTFEKKIALFVEDVHHPSLRVKKMRGYKNRWEASIDMFYRFTFEIHNDHYLLRRIGPHDRVLRNP
jgi:mRNA interferase RelE/StbE